MLFQPSRLFVSKGKFFGAYASIFIATLKGNENFSSALILSESRRISGDFRPAYGLKPSGRVGRIAGHVGGACIEDRRIWPRKLRCSSRGRAGK